MKRLAGKVAVVTGVGAGIGAAIPRAFAAEGADLVLVSRGQTEALDLTAADAQELGASVEVVRGDVKDRETWTKLKAAGDRLGGVDIVVNSAAIRVHDVTVLGLTESQWDETLNVNLKSVFFSAQTFLPEMIERGAGVFVNISSVNGLIANPKMIDYATSKSALHGFTRNLALDFGLQGIRANVIAPGAIFTEGRIAAMEEDEKRSIRDNYVVGRWGVPEDIASAAVFLASDEAAFITGVILPVDGGLTIQTPEAAVRKSFRAKWRDDALTIHDE